MSEGRVFHPSGGPMLTKQSEKDSTDVNLIMDSWVQAGAAVAGYMNAAPGSYGDFSSGIDYHAALDAVKEADVAFMALSPKIRSHVKNDPGEYLDMMFDPARREEVEQLGIVDSEVPVGAGTAARGAAEGPSGPVKEEAPVVDSPAAGAAGDAPGSEPKEGADPARGLFD